MDAIDAILKWAYSVGEGEKAAEKLSALTFGIAILPKVLPGELVLTAALTVPAGYRLRPDISAPTGAKWIEKL